MSTTDADNLVHVCCCLVDGSRLLWGAKYRRGTSSIGSMCFSKCCFIYHQIITQLLQMHYVRLVHSIVTECFRLVYIVLDFMVQAFCAFTCLCMC